MIIPSVSEEQLKERFQVLPQELADALVSPSLKAAVESLVSTYGLPEEGGAALKFLVSMVFMGYIDPDELGKELAGALGLKDEDGKALVLRLNREIWGPYRSAIQSTKASTSAAAASLSPVLNLKSMPAPMPVTAFPMAPASSVILSTAKDLPSPASKKTSAPTNNEQRTTNAPPPFILQKSGAPEAVVQSSSFRLNLDPKMFGGGPSRPVAPPPPPPRVAELELGRTEKKDLSKGASIPALPPRVVHYSEAKGSLGIMPMPASMRPPDGQPVPSAPKAPPSEMKVPASPATAMPSVPKSPPPPPRPSEGAPPAPVRPVAPPPSPPGGVPGL